MSTRIDENFIVMNDFVQGDERDLFFSGESSVPLEPNATMWDVLFMAGIFPSKSQARKNWNRTGAEIPEGFSHFQHIGKRHNEVCVFKPTRENQKQ